MEKLFAKIREALRAGPHREHPGPAPGREADPAALRRLFAAMLERASGRLLSVPSESAARAHLAGEFAGRRVVDLADGPDPREIEAADVGVDRADVLLAETGTILRSYPDRESSRISLVPAVSVFLATPDLLVADLPAALGRIAPAHREGRAYTVMITGPSRTADIEKELVIPAHGPRELVVLMVES
jgi:L-lactate utilization protein LutC